ncbi:diguanylate cyclase [Cohaesibacter celericrescens]|uniref:diguanylate cyclase n=1 Tax=Cohaesibacter celericrescens TaxID=2067669 RepID=A0A2N5XNK3_9HYPH|nr:diguanylate cyclase [Cohaesibacter celericrescens]PLW76121.1 diguanylate cyclase response regulator [Cohaesibacter celericrescens]
MKIVLVEANSVDRRAIKSMLEERRETVFSFSNGQEAWSFIQDTPGIDVIITSLNVQGMSGLEICWNSRILAEQRKAMYVIAISKQEESDMLVEALDSGADDYLQKPLHEETMLARLRVAERMIRLQKQLVQLANHDSMTGLFNRRAFFEKANQRLNQCVGCKTLSAIMFDIDHFKRVNDNFGHDAGDEVIKTVAKISSLEGNLLCRLGGEEFALILENHSLLSAARVAERLRATIEQTPIVVNGHKIQITSSFGVAICHKGDSIDDLLKRSDVALYHSKHNGRNRVSIERLVVQSQNETDASQIHARQKSRA